MQVKAFDTFDKEVVNAAEYNKRYVHQENSHRKCLLNSRNLLNSKTDKYSKYWLSLTEQEQQNFAQSYMDFITYMKIHKR